MGFSVSDSILGLCLITESIDLMATFKLLLVIFKCEKSDEVHNKHNNSQGNLVLSVQRKPLPVSSQPQPYRHPTRGMSPKVQAAVTGGSWGGKLCKSSPWLKQIIMEESLK